MALGKKGRTGQGCTVAFSTAGFNACVRSIQLPTWSQEKIDITCIEDKGYTKYMAGDLTDAGECQITMLWNPADDIGDDANNANPGDLIVGKTDTITVTFPTYSDGAGGGQLSGTGFISQVDLPNLAVNQLLEWTVTFCFDGETGPTWTAGASGS